MGSKRPAASTRYEIIVQCGMVICVLFLLLLPSSAYAWCNSCNSRGCCPCPGEAQCLGSFSSCEEACGLVQGGGSDDLFNAQQRIMEQQRREAEQKQIEYEKLIGEAKTEIEKQNFKGAVDLLEKAIELIPSNRSALKQLLEETRSAMFEQARKEEERRHAAAVNEAIQGVLGRMDELRQTPEGRTNPPGFQGLDRAAENLTPPGFPTAAGSAARIDPRLLITPEIYKAAVAELSRLKPKRAGFQRQLSRVSRWDKGLRRDDREFEAMRDEATRDLIYEFIDHTPVSWGLGQFAKSGRITGATKAKIETGWELSKGIIGHVRGFTARETAEQVDKIAAGNISLRRAMAAIPLEEYPEPARRWLAGFGKAYDATLKLIVAGVRDKKSAEDCANAFVDVGEAIVPEAGIPILVQHGLIRSIKYWSAVNAQKSLSEALSRNWNAQRYLSGKIESLDAEISENERLVNGYLAVHRVTKKSRR